MKKQQAINYLGFSAFKLYTRVYEVHGLEIKSGKIVMEVRLQKEVNSDKPKSIFDLKATKMPYPMVSYGRKLIICIEDASKLPQLSIDLKRCWPPELLVPVRSD